MRELSDLAGVPPAVSGASAILLRSPGLHDDRESACASLSMAGNPDGVVAVTYRGTPAEWLDRMQGHRGSPGTVQVVTVGDALGGSAETDARVRPVENPDDLTGLEITVTEALSALPDGPATLCFDSVTALLQYATVEEAYRLLHPLVERLHTQGVVGHFHVDPVAHEEQPLTALTGLFDASVELGDGPIEVRTSAGIGPDAGEEAEDAV
ncbi:DUF7504 family protein [Haloglomus litoreum]|uniref:DUF7504 family protein n=1 Tax=Haloglomus litoreum TaxID=3034026 RepID=UPI0023E77402|nr:hypothetical protein [Haloglomus sp. DT116]